MTKPIAKPGMDDRIVPKIEPGETDMHTELFKIIIKSLIKETEFRGKI